MTGKELKELREAVGISQKKLSEATGVAYGTISTIEANPEKLIKKVETLKLFENYFENKGFNNQPNKTNGVPFYDLDVTASITGSYLDIKEKPEYYVDIPPFNDCDAYTRVYGDSMYPKYQSGDIIALKKINNMEFMRWGHVHLVVSDNYYDDLRTIKEIHPCEDDSDCIILRSSNPNFKGDNKVKKKHILGIFLVKGKVRQDYM